MHKFSALCVFRRRCDLDVSMLETSVSYYSECQCSKLWWFVCSGFHNIFFVKQSLRIFVYYVLPNANCRKQGKQFLFVWFVKCSTLLHFWNETNSLPFILMLFNCCFLWWVLTQSIRLSWNLYIIYFPNQTIHFMEFTFIANWWITFFLIFLYMHFPLWFSSLIIHNTSLIRIIWKLFFIILLIWL